MKIVYNQSQFNKAVEVLSICSKLQPSVAKANYQNILHALIEATSKTEDTMIVSSGFVLIKELDLEAGIDYIQIFVDASYEDTDSNFIELEFQNKSNLN